MERLSDKLLNWASILDDVTRRQAENTASLAIIAPHVALMPDAHLGKGATVGSVLPTRRAIIPAAVGVDIGCGMIAVRTPWTVEEVRARGSLAPLRGDIERAVPLSAGKYNKRLTESAKRRAAELEELAAELGDHVLPAVTGATPNWQLQLGSLGSGNHFIEVTADEQDRVWLFLHSGSRGVGNKIAMRHIAIARKRAERERLDLPDRDLAWLEEGTPEFDRYIAELRWAQHFALLNREEMMDRVAGCLAVHMRADETPRLEVTNCHHNFTQRETHDGVDLWVSRKGAIEARKGQPGLIPGSMGTASYVVAGLGNPLSLNSSPHGAGRAYSRNQARRTFTRAQLEESMQGIEWRHSDAFLDEIPAAYKPVDVVMEDAKDLVEVRHTLRQLVNVKGD
ncbi:RtcB family protein [Blastococcus sp. CT_GayMR20]|uniref:RtcB family protein n=1 Tax=Blastococcus sp. CT_GayMR20 TaxID=2559609 RepID=UPI001073A5E4|nr:RtcB family protein [Blastococcus sp. CT_GayMR20]TFV92443.1 RtcB family protein [Blastococcus sp. CT_GayMR20]TFV92528.1 RtcB family protein [Blastococcus sp. CT_GayMR20]